MRFYYFSIQLTSSKFRYVSFFTLLSFSQKSKMVVEMSKYHIQGFSFHSSIHKTLFCWMEHAFNESNTFILRSYKVRWMKCSRWMNLKDSLTGYLNHYIVSFYIRRLSRFLSVSIIIRLSWIKLFFPRQYYHRICNLLYL